MMQGNMEEFERLQDDLPLHRIFQSFADLYESCQKRVLFKGAAGIFGQKKAVFMSQGNDDCRGKLGIFHTFADRAE